MPTDLFLADYFATVFSAYMTITAPGVYSFMLSSDDGSRLLIKDQTNTVYQVIDNGGRHAVIDKSGTVSLVSRADPR